MKQMEDAYNFIDLCNMRYSAIVGLNRKEERDYPEAAIREGLINSILHRDYSKNADTIISIFDDRIEFVSIGGLCDGTPGISESKCKRSYRIPLIYHSQSYITKAGFLLPLQAGVPC